MIKKVSMTILLAILLLITSSLAQSAHAAGNKADMSIYNRCARTSLQLFVISEQRNCIMAQPLPQKLRREEAKSSSTPQQNSTKQPSQQKPYQTQPTPTNTTPVVATPTHVPVTPVVTQSAPEAEGAQLNADVLFSMVNDVRVQNGLAPFEKDQTICDIVASRAPELYNEIFVNYNMHAGFYNRNLPYWATENMIYQNTEQQALNWWLNSSVHRSAIFGDYKFSCCACQGKACAQIFTNYLPK